MSHQRFGNNWLWQFTNDWDRAHQWLGHGSSWLEHNSPMTGTQLTNNWDITHQWLRHNSPKIQVPGESSEYIATLMWFTTRLMLVAVTITFSLISDFVPTAIPESPQKIQKVRNKLQFKNSPSARPLRKTESSSWNKYKFRLVEPFYKY